MQNINALKRKIVEMQIKISIQQKLYIKWDKSKNK